ncbi:hypothetical protein X801_08879, partial [Opisthorchis viverrini]
MLRDLTRDFIGLVRTKELNYVSVDASSLYLLDSLESSFARSTSNNRLGYQTTAASDEQCDTRHRL